MAQIAALTGNANPNFAIGPNGATNPTLSADGSVASAATGVKVKGNAAAAGADLFVTSSGTNENLRIDAKGSGTITLGTTSTGNVASARPVVITDASAASLAVGANGATNPGLLLDNSTSSAATGIKVKPAAAAAGVAVSAISSGTDENMTVDAKGAGTLTLNATATGKVKSPRGFVSTAAGVGYDTGAGGTVTQGTNRTTAVTINKITGAITLVSAAGSATPASFTVNNSLVAATDVIILNQKSGTDKLDLKVTAVGSGTFEITFNTTGGTTTEQPVINFAVIKGVAA